MSAGTERMSSASCSHCGHSSPSKAKSSASALALAVKPLVDLQRTANDQLSSIQTQLTNLQRHLSGGGGAGNYTDWLMGNRDVFLLGLMLAIQVVVMWLFGR